MKTKGIIHLVGAGPGEAGLLTLRGAELLRRARVVFHDPGVSASILRLAAQAELTPMAAAAEARAGQIERILARAAQGEEVVRLVEGEACAGGEASAELRELARAGTAFEVVPGLSASHRGHSQCRNIEGLPLSGRRVVVTRALDQAGKVSELLRERGAEPIEIPVIRIAPPDDRQSLSEALAGLHEYDWLVFTSANGVASFFDLFFRAFKDLRDLGGVRIAAVGPATAARIEALHLTVDAMPEEALGKKVAKAIEAHGSLENLRVCLLRAQKAGGDLPKLLEGLGAIVDDVACYQTLPETGDPEGRGEALQRTGADWLLFTSGSTVEHFHARFNLPELLRKFPGLRTASIGPETSLALQALSLAPSVEAREHTVPGLLRAMETAGR